jgi:hypothetical protein
MGASVWDAFREAEKTIYLIGKKQVAQLDDDGDGKDTVRDGPMARLCQIGMGFSLGSDPPMIGSACRNRILDGRNSATIWVSDVATTGTIKKVWGLVVPPGYQPGSSPIPGAGFPSFELQRQASGRYQYVYPGFTAPGQYLVTVFATDTEGNVSQPKVIKVTRK